MAGFGLPNFGQLTEAFKKAKQIQQDAQKLQDELENMEIEGESDDEMIKIWINGNQLPLKVQVNEKILNSDIGIAAKDYAEFYGIDINISDVNTCLSAYKKKQEFSGGYLFIKNLECKNYNIFKDMDKQSRIIINTNDI